jgi:glycosyltransferase involved in cell wall biosynthesis
MVHTCADSLDMSGIRISMLAPCLGKFGGIETFCLTLIEDLVKRGASVRLLRKRVAGFVSDGSIERNEKEIWNSWTTNDKVRFTSEYIDRGHSRIKEAIEQCDLVHLHNPMVEGVWWAMKRETPCVMTIYNWRRKGLHPRLLAWRWAVARADRRWYISEFVWDSWEKRRKEGSARLPVVSRMPKGEIPASERRGFLFLGRWIPNKGIRVLLKAYKRLSPDPQQWPLILVGDGPLRPKVERLIREYNVRGVELPGFVSEEKRQIYTRRTKWMVTPPHTREDLGLTPLEARSVGVPCIVSTDGGVTETGGPYALRCIPGDVESLFECMRIAINMDESTYEEKCRQAKVELEKYVRPLDEYAQEYLNLIEEK